MLQWFSGKKRKGVAWLLLFLLCFSMVNAPMRARALEELGLVGDSFDTLNNVFKIYGRHIFVDNDVWTYKTKAFNVASWECADITNPPSTVKTARLEINQNLSNLEIIENVDYTKSTYVISGQAFANAFQTLFQEDIDKAVARGDRSVTRKMFFNNIFQVVHRTTPGMTKREHDAPMYPVYSFQSPEEYHTASAMAANQYVTSWSASDFTGFYNFPYEYTVNILETKINYVDKSGRDLVAGADSVYGLKKGTGRYTLPEKIITVDGKSYVYDGSYVVDYKNGNPPGRSSSPDGSFNWTIENDGMEVDICFAEDTTRTKVPVVINLQTSADGSSYTTAKSFPYGREVLSKEKFTYIPAATYKDSENNIYNYTKKWYYTYTDLNGTFKMVTSVSGETPKIDSVPQVKDGTSLNVYIRYDMEKKPETVKNKDVKIRINTQISDTGAEYSNAATTSYGTLKTGAAFSYNPPATYTKNSVKYNYVKQWYYTYVNPEGETITELPDSEAPDIASLPETKKDTFLDVYINYIKEEVPKEEVIENVKVRIITQIDVGGTYIDAMRESFGASQTGNRFSYDPPETYTSGSDTYNYIYEWYYTYVDTTGVTKTKTPTSTKPDIDSLPAVKEGTTLDVYIRYKKAVPPPVKNPSSDQTAPTNQGSHWKEVATPESKAGIRAEEENLNRYDVQVGIATQEDLYSFGHATSYMFGYNIAHQTGTKTYPIRVDKKYVLKWREGVEEEDADGDGAEEGDEEEAEPEILTEEVTLTTYVYVTRGYAYWEIESFEMYVADTMTLYNYALPNGSVTMPVNSGKLNPVELNVSVTDYSDNMNDPETASSGIILETETIETKSDKKPEIPQEDFETLAFNAAHSKTGNIKVWNDSLVYRNIAVLDAATKEYVSMGIRTDALEWSKGSVTADLFHTGNMVIDAQKDNGVYYSSGSVTYKALSCNVGGEWSKTYPLTYDPNNVLIHTPVLCKGVVSSDNNKYVQQSSPLNGGDVHHLVLDENGTLNDFTVSISNYGEHLNADGYLTRDYRKIKRLPDSDLSNIERTSKGTLRNEVKFGFDVYADIGNDYDTSNDIFYPAGTWFIIGEKTQRFYLPLTVKEGFYGADFRTVAVNANGRLTLTQERRNTIWHNYVATDSALFEVSGRVYGLNVRDISDYPIWEEVFRIPGINRLKINYPDKYPLGVNSTTYSKDKSYNYTVGTKDQYGNETGRDPKFTLPLVGGSHPYYGGLVGILKRGYSVRFSLDTIGTYYDDTAKVVAYPTYYWVDKEGKNRTKVDLYYTATVLGKERFLIKSGESIDLANIARYRVGDRYLGIPQAELEITAAIRNILIGDWEWTYANLVYGAAKIEMTAPFRTYTGKSYADSVLSGPNADRVTDAGITEADLIKSKQSWYGSLFVPGNARAVDSTFDVFEYAKKIPIDYTESFWKKDGYIIVNLEIKVYDKDGKERLSYLNKVHEDYYCNMWKMEGPIIGKSDNGRVTMYFEPGDFMIYSVERSATEDHVVGGIY